MDLMDVFPDPDFPINKTFFFIMVFIDTVVQTLHVVVQVYTNSFFMSQIYFKFKAAKDFDTATFDGTSISAFDLKRQIMLTKKLGKGTDFDLVISNAQSGEGYNYKNKCFSI
jgi:hypothetical protein